MSAGSEPCESLSPASEQLVTSRSVWAVTPGHDVTMRRDARVEALCSKSRASQRLSCAPPAVLGAAYDLRGDSPVVLRMGKGDVSGIA